MPATEKRHTQPYFYEMKGNRHHISSNLLDEYVKHLCTLILCIDCKGHCHDYFRLTCVTSKSSKVK